MHKKHTTVAILTIILGLLSSQAQSAPFHKDVPYQDAVPAFLEAITGATESVKDEEELNDIAAWEEEARGRLPEFLDDLITIAQRLEDEGTNEFIFEEYTAFARKWNQIAAEYPGLQELDPLISPLIDELLAGLPTLQPPPSDNPLSGLADLYRALEIEDPWGLGGFFVLEPLPDSNKKIQVSELVSETRKSGVKNKQVVSRETVATLNGVVVYFELIQNGQIVQRFVNFRDPGIIHETLDAMKQNNEDPAVIAALEDIVDLIDTNLQLALANGVLDQCSYNFIYRKSTGNIMQNCTGIDGEQQELLALTRFDPFDDVNQVKLSDPEQIVAALPDAGVISLKQPLALQSQTIPDPEAPPLLQEYQQGFQGATQTYFMGFLFPAYLLSLIGLFRGI